MDTRNDGGPAFPRTGEGFVAGRGLVPMTDGGMSLRDYFAGQALAGLVINNETCTPTCPLSVRAYEIADAMLATRDGSG